MSIQKSPSDDDGGEEDDDEDSDNERAMIDDDNIMRSYRKKLFDEMTKDRTNAI